MEATEGADWNAHLINSETTNLQWSSSDHIVQWAWLFWFSWRPGWAHRQPQHTFCPGHFLSGFPVSLNTHRWDATPGWCDRDGRQVWASQGGCVPGQGSTPGEHRLPARSAARLAPSPALCPDRDAEPWLAAVLGRSGCCSGEGTCSSRASKCRGRGARQGTWDSKTSNVAPWTCRSVPVAWPSWHWSQQQISLCLQRVWRLPTLPPPQGKACPLWGGWRVALPPLAECRCEVVEMGCQKLQVKAGLEPVSSKKHMLTLFIFPVMFAISNKNK